ncbi:MAG: flavodoxin family protein [Syntrophales bacterium]|jgi:putative NADPH-quinone reductase|nr:flavodoxin family protein [Syntrophales bacterium]MDD4340368.1 flavodoxin family protein [Syntrophales bacterium]HOD29362.1 flavodoxin family protein [Syntrophales bacterium]HOG18745.1 flavodoxin family protein [Syntrophales bacterium]HOS78254.1 flavodoxin family protein [Syntrophales bacterium]
MTTEGMRVLAFNGSPRDRRGNTEKILQPFLEGAAAAGAVTETLYLKELKIRECQGCYACHMLTPGRCAIRDDMTWVLEKMLASDVLVFASPLYVFTVSAYLKTLLDRMMILGTLEVKVVDGVVVHPPRFPERKWRWVVISNAGFPERELFEPMEGVFRRFAWAIGGGTQVTIAGMILKGMGELFSVPSMLPNYQWFFDACRQAGGEVVREGAIAPATQAVLDRPLLDVDPEAFAAMSNTFIDLAAKKARSRKTGQEKTQGTAVSG